MLGGEGEDQFGYQDFLKIHKAQLEHAGIPEHYHRTIYEKTENETYDSGNYFILLTDGEGWEVRSTRAIDATDANTIFLVDHCWTFLPEQAKKALASVPGLARRIASILGVTIPEEFDEQEESSTELIGSPRGGRDIIDPHLNTLIDKITECMWTITETYTIQKDDDKLGICYIMDELGSRVIHSETPNMKFAPFFHITKQFAITLMWPMVTEIADNTLITRDITFGESNKGKRAAALSCITRPDLDHLTLGEVKLDPYKMYGRKEQTLAQDEPSGAEHPCNIRLAEVTKDNPLKLCVDMQFVKKSVNHPLIQVVEGESEADVVFSSCHFDQYQQLFTQTPAKFVNQFPSENIICCKDLLLKVARRATLEPDLMEHSDDIIAEVLNSAKPGWAHRLHPKWLPIGFDLVNELPVFVRHYLEREEAGEDNTWIIKPWNLARSKYTYVTDNLAMITKLAYTSPKVIQKYIDRPVLFNRDDVGHVKFDIRYVLLLKSVSPLVLYKYNVFWLRFANKPFQMDEFDEYEKHFTVMNYTETELKQVHSDEFIVLFEKQYPEHNWADIDRKICKMFKECFESAAALPPPRGLGHSEQARAIYAADFMLEWSEDELSMEPKLLEINFNPDNQRACKYHPTFYDDCLQALFFGDKEGIPVSRIC